jgi:hypothetical protein
MDFIDHAIGSQDSKLSPGIQFSHGHDRICFSRYVSGLHDGRNCTTCPDLSACRRDSSANQPASSLTNRKVVIMSPQRQAIVLDDNVPLEQKSQPA